MPSLSFLPERDRWALVAYIKTFSETWVEDADDQEPEVQINDPPLPDEAMLLAGKAAYEEMKCAKCHGKSGTGDGPSANELEDDNGLPIARVTLSIRHNLPAPVTRKVSTARSQPDWTVRRCHRLLIFWKKISVGS